MSLIDRDSQVRLDKLIETRKKRQAKTSAEPTRRLRRRGARDSDNEEKNGFSEEEEEEVVEKQEKKIRHKSIDCDTDNDDDDDDDENVDEESNSDLRDFIVEDETESEGDSECEIENKRHAQDPTNLDLETEEKIKENQDENERKAQINKATHTAKNFDTVLSTSLLQFLKFQFVQRDGTAEKFIEIYDDLLLNGTLAAFCTIRNRRMIAVALSGNHWILQECEPSVGRCLLCFSPLRSATHCLVTKKTNNTISFLGQWCAERWSMLTDVHKLRRKIINSVGCSDPEERAVEYKKDIDDLRITMIERLRNRNNEVDNRSDESE